MIPIPKKTNKDNLPSKEIREFAEKYACQLMRVKGSGEIARLIGYSTYGVYVESGIREKIFTNIPPDTKWPFKQGMTWYFTCSATPGHFYHPEKLEPLYE